MFIIAQHVYTCYNIFRGNNFSDCRLKKPLVFDFFLPVHNILIEFDGEQHIRPVEIWGGEKTFQLQRKRDEIKNNYCKNNGITLVRIGYYENIEQKIKRYI